MLFQRKSISKNKSSFKDNGKTLINPYQGWYRPYPFNLAEVFDAKEEHWCLHEEEPLCLVEITLEAYASMDLPQEALYRLQEILQFFDQEEKQVILRFAYDFDGNAMGKEPTVIDQILTHMEQVASVTKAFATMILCYQGLFIGNWGEMHGSRYATDGCMKKLYLAFRKYFGADAMLALRRLEWVERYGMKNHHLCVFDDGIFGTENDMGTFQGTRTDGLARMHALGASLPMGGEVLGQSLQQGVFSKEDILHTMEKMHISYLNGQYDMVGLDYLEHQGLLPIIKQKLGYRLFVSKVSGTAESLQVVLCNRGWGSLFLPTTFFLLDGDGSVLISRDVTQLGAEESVTLEFSCPGYTGQLFLRAMVNKKYEIQFANEGKSLVLLGEIRYA